MQSRDNTGLDARMDYNIPEKANKVLNFIILGLLLILVRVWYLTIIQHEQQLEKARKPKRRTIVEKVERATIRDRFNIPLAINKIQYNAAVCYSDIRQIPVAKWQTNADGKRIRVPSRSNYIKELSRLLADLLKMDAQSIEDIIHAKASLFPHTPFVLKEGLTEEEYYRLKLMEKDWVGIRTEKGSSRYYPLGKVGSDVIGYMGAISSKEYFAIANELHTLQAYLTEREAGEIPVLPKGFQNPLEVRERVKVLQEKAYTINDLVGKTGVEKIFDADLRGYAGKKTWEVDTKGNFLRELPGSRESVSGQRLLLSLSAELQEFAEHLLIQNEKKREARHPNGDPDLSTPWIKGGAIVALDPNTGEVIALASYPRLDPNDFISSKAAQKQTSKQSAVTKWLENEGYIGEIWDGKKNLERERYNEKTGTVYTESCALTWEKYLEIILSAKSSVFAAMQKISTLSAAVSLQKEMQLLLKLAGEVKMHTLINALYCNPFYRPSSLGQDLEEKKSALENLEQNKDQVSLIRMRVDPILGQIKCNDDKLLVIDLCTMLAEHSLFSSEILEHLGSLSLEQYHLLNQSASILKSFSKIWARNWFHQNTFQIWRENHFKEYLKKKRQEEKQKKHYAKPYTDYLEQMEKQMFETFWQENSRELLYTFIFDPKDCPSDICSHAETIQRTISSLPIAEQKAFLRTLRSFDELDRPLYGKYRALRSSNKQQNERHLAAAFYPLAGYGYGRSQAFRQSTPQGSLFKLIVAYQMLIERHHHLKELQESFSDLNPLTLVDNLQWHPKPGSLDQVLGYTLSGEPIKSLYKGGRLIRSSHANIGKIDIVSAIERSSNFYFCMLAVDHIEDPLHLIDASKQFGFGEKTGIELPGEFAGLLPNDLSYNRSGLYAFAIGQHSFVVTPLQTAVMLAAIANKGEVLKPKVVQVIAGHEPLREYRDPFTQALYPFKENLASIGIQFPLFTSALSDEGTPHIWYNETEKKHTLPMPDPVRDILVKGMFLAINGEKGTARPGIIRSLSQNPTWMRHYQELRPRLIGKTGTAEILYKQAIDAESEAKMQNHVWFGGVAFANETPQSWEHPELVVVVYLRLSEAGGKEAAPLGTEVIKKWEEICKRHGKKAYTNPGK